MLFSINICLLLGLRQGTLTSRSLIRLFQTISVSDRQYSCCNRLCGIFRSGAIFANKMKGTYKVVVRKLWQIKMMFRTSACMNLCHCPRSVSLFTWKTDLRTLFLHNDSSLSAIWLSRIIFTQTLRAIFRHFNKMTGDRMNASGGCEAAVTARARIGWVKFKECGELLNSKRFSLKTKGMVYRSCYMGVRLD